MQKEVAIRTAPNRLKTLVLGNTTFRSAHDHELSENDQKQARLELKETEHVRKPCLQKLKELLSRDEGSKYREDDAYLLRYLRYRKFNSEEAYKCIRKFYSTRKNNPQFFSLPANLEYQLNTGIFTYLPYRDEEGSIIFLNKFDRWNMDELELCDLLQIFHIIADVINMNPSCQINGIISIWDVKNISTNQLAKCMHPSTLRLWTKVLQKIYPWRLKSIIVLHCTRALQAVLNAVLYVILNKKIAERVVILRSDMSRLHEYVNPSLLPKEYGGRLDENDCSVTRHIMDNVPYLKYERSFTNGNK